MGIDIVINIDIAVVVDIVKGIDIDTVEASIGIDIYIIQYRYHRGQVYACLLNDLFLAFGIVYCCKGNVHCSSSAKRSERLI